MQYSSSTAKLEAQLAIAQKWISYAMTTAEKLSDEQTFENLLKIKKDLLNIQEGQLLRPAGRGVLKLV